MEDFLMWCWFATFVTCIVGFIRPAWIRLPSRWAVAAIFAFSFALVSAASEFYPSSDGASQSGSTLAFICVTTILCGIVVFFRIAIRTHKMMKVRPSEAGDGFVEAMSFKWAAFNLKSKDFQRAAQLESRSAQQSDIAQEERRRAGEAFIKHLSERRKISAARREPVDISKLELAIRDVQVTPKKSPRLKGRVAPTETEAVSAPVRDHSSGWAGYINYVDSKGEASERQIVVKRIEGYGRAEIVFAWCCEREAHRRFLIKGIKELCCAETGEVLNPKKHFDLLASEGAIGTTDKSLADLVTILVFLARCDGEFHPLEMDSVEAAIDQHMIYFGGDRKSSRKAALNARKLAPDNIDFMNAMNRLGTHPQCELLAGIILDAADNVVEADGKVTDAEAEWQGLVFSTLENMASVRAA